MRLPIEARLPELVAAVREGNVVLVALPGAGKTTALPPALLAARADAGGAIWVLQPRRLAARLAAERVAHQLGESVGERCGYQVRFESAVGPATRILFVTEGVLTRRLRERPDLPGVDVVMLDEFHERHLDGDVALALLRRLQLQSRPQLRLVVMSATIQPEPLARFLDATVIEVEGRAFPVKISYAPDPRQPLESRVARAVRALPGADGHVLVFLPGAKEIRACAAACRGFAHAAGYAVHTLQASGSRESQDRAVRPSSTPKLVFATNVAETSITIDGVATVIDSGLARLATHDPWTGVSRLRLSPISRASADQRAGRAGRTRPGTAIRLYDRHEFARRPSHELPEIRRLDLAGVALDLLAAEAQALQPDQWFESPPQAALDAARALLDSLGATRAGRLTPVGRAMLRLPIHPRLARVLVEAQRVGVAELACGVVALLSEPAIRSGGPHDERSAEDSDADVLVELDLLDRFGRDLGSTKARGLDFGTCRRVNQLRRQLEGLAGNSTAALHDFAAREHALRRCILLGFPDRVARIREDGSDRRTLVLCGGGSAQQSPRSVVRTAGWVVGLALEERREGGHKAQAMVRSVCAIEPEWLLECFADRIEDCTELRFDSERERVSAWSELRYGQLVIAGSALARLPAEAAALLAEAALARGARHFVPDPELLAQFLHRVHFGHRHDPGIPALDAAVVDATLAALCDGRQSFEELREADLLAHLHARLGGGASRLAALAPTHVRLASGRRLLVHYELDRPPWVASRLQDFFGAEHGPSLLEGRLPLVMHLRAPNGRDVQVTTDLGGFWARHYPQLRQALMRRYPRHAWPEDPRHAAPPAASPLRSPTRRRRR